ncbi:MAG: hypothetical protein EBY57_02940 [Actinobacteria bacterium]|nr:hypothetical protein [Actinomycetota bacterium]
MSYPATSNCRDQRIDRVCLEQRNLSSAARNVYIHGTNILSSLGEGAKSGGCIRVSPETAYTLVRFAQSGVTGVYVLDRPWIGRSE